MPRAHHLDLPLILDREGGEPLGAQLAGQLRDAMRDGLMAAGERLPSGRTLAGLLGVSRGVVTEAYEQLYAEGWLEGRHGSGTFVADIHPAAHVTQAASGEAYVPRAAPPGSLDLRPGVPALEWLDTPAWRRAWRLAATVPPVSRPDPRGLPGLRAELAEYMRRSRGVAGTAEQIMVTSGATSALDLLAATLLKPGDRVGVEEPGYRRATSVLSGRAAEVVPCPVDEHGLIVEALPPDLKLVYATPSHQYPLGGVLPVPRRQALLTWAHEVGALIAEDDYDGEFRYDVAPLPALYGMDPDVVVYLGTTAKILTAEVGVGWLAARPDLVTAIARRREELSDRTAAMPQEAVRILLERGDLDRYIRRMRAEYARRRALVVELLGDLPLRGDTAGLHLVLELPPGTALPIIERAAERGVLLDALDRHYVTPYRQGRSSGLVIGYGSARLGELRAGCAVVRELVGQLRSVAGV